MNERHTYITYVAKSKIESKEMQVIHFDQDVQVCGIYIFLSNPNIFWVLLWSWLSLFLIIALEVWAISLFQYFGTFMCSILFSSFLLLFWELHVSLFFSIALYFFWHMRLWRERLMTNEWSFYFRWTKNMFLRNSQCKS